MSIRQVTGTAVPPFSPTGSQPPLPAWSPSVLSQMCLLVLDRSVPVGLCSTSPMRSPRPVTHHGLQIQSPGITALSKPLLPWSMCRCSLCFLLPWFSFSCSALLPPCFHRGALGLPCCLKKLCCSPWLSLPWLLPL